VRRDSKSISFIDSLVDESCSFGPMGFFVIYRSISVELNGLLKKSGMRITRYKGGSDALLRTVLIPHATCILISEDRQCSLEEAPLQMWLSEPYGSLEFPFDEENEVLKTLEKEGTGKFKFKITAPNRQSRSKTLRPRDLTKSWFCLWIRVFCLNVFYVFVFM